MLSAVEPGIDGPLAGPDQRQRHAKHRQCGGNTRVGRRRERDPRFGTRRHHSGDGRPQAGDEKEASQRSDHLRRRNRATGCRGHAVHQSSADQQPLHQKPGARPAVRERGEQPLHKVSHFQLTGFATILKHSKVWTPCSTFGGLQFDDPALQPDGNGVRAVVRSQLLEDVADVAFHRILSN